MSNLVRLLLCTSVSTLMGSLQRGGILHPVVYICGFDRCCWVESQLSSLISCRALALSLGGDTAPGLAGW